MQFCLIVDDFGIAHTNKTQVHRLAAVLCKHYEITINWTGTIFWVTRSSGTTIKDKSHLEYRDI